MSRITLQTGAGGDREFELVDHVPFGYTVWNIGKNMADGYLPLCRIAARQPFPGCRSIETDTLKAIKTEHAQTILAGIGIGGETVEEMERYIEKHPNKWGVDRMKAALPYMREIKGL